MPSALPSRQSDTILMHRAGCALPLAGLLRPVRR